jgi:hypothetical protein
MKYKKTIYTLVLMGVSLTMPVLASANGVQYSEENRNEPSSFILKVQTERWELDRPPIGGKGVYSYDSELAEGTWGGKSGERESRDSSSVMDTQSSSSPSADFPPSVGGHTGGVDRPFFGGSPSGGDPAVKDLSGMDGGGFAPPGAYTGSERRR